MSKARIFCYIETGGWPRTDGGRTDVGVVARTEDGTLIGWHTSSDEAWAKHDIGITSERKHARYRELFPDGFELIWCESETDALAKRDATPT